jgi:hypothetical protein
LIHVAAARQDFGGQAGFPSERRETHADDGEGDQGAPWTRAREVSRRADYETCPFAWVSWLLVVVQIPETLPPVPRKSAADAIATNAIRSVYSIKS